MTKHFDAKCYLSHKSNLHCLLCACNTASLVLIDTSSSVLRQFHLLSKIAALYLRFLGTAEVVDYKYQVARSKTSQASSFTMIWGKARGRESNTWGDGLSAGKLINYRKLLAIQQFVLGSCSYMRLTTKRHKPPGRQLNGYPVDIAD